MKRINNKLAIALTLVGLTSGINAAIIAFAGSVIDDAGSEVTQWRTASTTKSLDFDGDNVYGSFGGIAFGDAVVGAMSFVSSQTQVGPFGGYATIDDINGGVDRQVATTSNGGGTGNDIVMYTFQVNAIVATSDIMRVGIGIDGLNGAQYSPASIGLVELGGGGGTAEVAVTGNSTIDMIFFDVLGGIASGTRFQVIADDNGGGDFATHQLVSLDVAPAPVPEPSSTALLGLGGLALILRRRR